MAMTTTIRRSMLLLQIESVLTAMIFAMPILNNFFVDEIHMTFAQIGLSQAAFTAALLLLNAPTGWLADRFSRRACNFAGDVLASIGFGLYAMSTTFSHIIGCEILIGIGLAFSGGADIALLRAYSKEIGDDFEPLWARLTAIRPIGEIVAVVIGGVVGAHHPRVAIALSAVTYGIGAVLSLMIAEVGERRITQHSPLRDMLTIGAYALRGHKSLAWSIAAFAITREVTHGAVWLLTPILLLSGVPASVVGVGWAVNLAMVTIGATFGRRFGIGMSDIRRTAIGMCLPLCAGVILATHLGYSTVWAYGLFGLARGWSAAVVAPIMQRHAPDDIQSTVHSVAATVAQLLYAPVIWGIGAMGDVDVRLALIGNVVLFGILAIPVIRGLGATARVTEKR